jgi:branched-chain amino acid transport system substrate-binding protein
MRRVTAAIAAAIIGAVVVAGCGGDDGGGSGGGSASASGGSLTIYSSLPLQGASKNQAEAILNGMKLALEQAGGKVGDHKIKFTSLDDSTAQAGAWTPEATAANARKAAQDDSTISYLGEFNSGASAVSIPVLNEAGVPQNGLTNGAVGLTSDAAGSEPGEPDKYYPTGERHYVRILPKDTVQGAALVTMMKEDGCTNAFVTNDKEVFGAGLGRNIEIAAKEQGLNVIQNAAIDKNAANYRSLASSANSKGADCMAYAGITANNAVQLFKDFSAAIPNAKLYGPDGIAESGFTDPKEGGIPADVGAKVRVSIAVLPPDKYPPEGQQFFKDYAAEYGNKAPDPYAIYGYEGMALQLDAIKRAAEEGKVDKAAVIEQMFATKDRKSVLGTYSIDENGDTTLTDYGSYRISDGKLAFDKTIKAPPGS